MAEILNLDEAKIDVTVVFGGEKYALRDMDSTVLVYWSRKQRERARMQSRLEQMEEKMSAADLPDKQYEAFEGNVQGLEDKLRGFSAELLVKVLDGMTLETANLMSLRQQGLVFRTLGEGMEAINAKIAEGMETPEGEESQR